MDANAVATWAGVVVALLTAAVSWICAKAAGKRAQSADTRAERAEERADEAIELARSAEARADRLEHIATEIRDVVWVRNVAVGTNSDSTLSFRNTGVDSAHEVQLIVDPLRPKLPRITNNFASIEGGGLIGMNLWHVVAAADEKDDAIMFGNDRSADLVVAVVGGADVSARIVWRSASGVEGVQDMGTLKL